MFIFIPSSHAYYTKWNTVLMYLPKNTLTVFYYFIPNVKQRRNITNLLIITLV